MTVLTLAVVLDFEAAHPVDGGVKEGAIAAELGVRAARYYQLLTRYTATVEALEYDPVTTYRVRARITAQTRSRAERTLT